MEPLVARYREVTPHAPSAALDRYELVDMARKVVGIGSVGTRCWVLLLLGREHGDPLFLQAKEAQRVGARAVRRQGPVRATRASAWSRASA